MAPNKKHTHLKVVVIRDWKEYFGEAVLIIFSVLLALILTEVINAIHEKQLTKEYLQNIRNELIQNKTKEEEQYAYQLQVLKNIDSALNNPNFQQQIISDGEFRLKLIASSGILYRYLEDISWQVAKQHNIESKIDLQDLSALTNIYQEQNRIMKSEDEIARVVLDRESRNPANARITLKLIRDNYHGWAVDRAESLLKEYQKEIDNLK